MHVVHLDLERGWRGGERQVLLLARELAAREVPQTVVARRGHPLEERARQLAGLRVLGVGGRCEALLRLRSLARPLVFHAHTAGTLPLAVLARGAADAVIATRRLDLPATPFWLNRADRVVAISAAVERSLLGGGVDPARLALIPSGIDVDDRPDPSLRRPLRAALGLPPDAVLGLTVAALEPQKDPLTLVRALPLLPSSYHHLWVGEGSLAQEVRQLAAELGVADRLHLPGFDPAPDRHFAAADLFVLPSVHEGLGSILLDAFRAGLPVAATRIPGSAQLLEEGRTALLFDPGDAAGLAAAVARLANERSLASALAAGGRERLADYDIRRTAAAYLELYQACGREGAAG